MKKIYVSIWMAVLLCCHCISLPAAAAQTIQKQDIALLAELGLLRGDETGDYRLEDALMRSEYTALILRMLGYDELAESTKDGSAFLDVVENHWAKDYIRIARDMGLINGVSENLFEPDRSVSRTEALKIMVCALGYGPLAEHMGGYPGGYLKQANALGLLKKLGSGDIFTRGEACQLLTNALSVDIMNELGQVISGNDVLSQYLGITVMRGFVTGTDTVYDTKKVNKGYIEIEDKLYKLRYMPQEELFGCEVKFYLYQDNAGEEMIYYLAVYEDESRLEVASENILAATSLRSFCYTEEGDTESVSLAENLLIFYNGRRVTSAQMNESLLKPEQGTVILCDKEGDNVYDLAIVSDYRTIVVNYVNQDKIYDAYEQHVSIGSGAEVTILKNGQTVGMDSIHKGDVLAVAESLDGDNIRILADFESTTGSIFMISTDGNKQSYHLKTPEGETLILKAAKSYQEAVRRQLTDNLLKPDRQQVVLWLNAFGKIADVQIAEDGDQTANNTQYGFLVEAISEGALGGLIKIKVLTKNNQFKIFTIPSGNKVTFGRNVAGHYIQGSVSGETVLSAVGGNGSAVCQLIQYRANDEGILSQVFLSDYAGNADVISEDVPRSFLNYRQGVLAQQYYMDDKTVVFSIPEDGIYEDVMSSGNYKNFFTEGWSRQCTLYDVSAGHVGAVVVHDRVAITYASSDSGYETILNYASSPIFFIDDATQKLGEDGDVHLGLNGYQNGNQTFVYVSDELAKDSASISMLKPGVVIQYETNSNSKSWAMTADEAEQLVVFEKIFDFTTDSGSGIRWNHDIIVDDRPDILTLWGTLKAVDPAFCTVEAENDGQLENFAIQFLNHAVFMKYDTAKKEFIPISQYELVPGQKVYIVKQSDSQTVVVY